MCSHAGQCFASRIEPPECLRGSPHAVGPIEVAAHGDVQPRTGPSPRLLGDLKPHVVEDHRIVLTHRAIVLLAKDLLEVRRKERLRDGRNGAHYYHFIGLYEIGGPQSRDPASGSRCGGGASSLS
jgi:hypothetical protein